MSAKINAIITYILVSILTMMIEHSSGVSLNIYYYLDISLKTFSDATAPMLPTSGNWADSTNDALFLIEIVRFFLHVLSSPIPFIAANIRYKIDNE